MAEKNISEKTDAKDSKRDFVKEFGGPFTYEKAAALFGPDKAAAAMEAIGTAGGYGVPKDVKTSYFAPTTDAGAIAAINEALQAV